METKAAVLYQINKPLEIEELIIPELKRGQVLVKIAYSGICHSQLNEIRGLKGRDKYLPHTLGHEGSGIVERVGLGVEKVKPGDRVVLSWIKSRGADSSPASYKKSDGSLINSGAISTLLTRSVISENRLVKIPDQMPLKEAALLGCAVPTGAGIVMNTAKVQPGSSIAIFGMGGVGMSSLLACKLVKAGLIIAVDIDEDKLQQSIDLGASRVINAKKEDVLSKLLEITNKQGVDYAIEAAGKKESMEQSFQSVRDKGGLCIIAGNLSLKGKISIDPFDLIRGKRIIGTWGGETQPDKDIPKYVDLYLSGKLKLDKLITNTYALREINQAFYKLEQGVKGRIIVDMAGD